MSPGSQTSPRSWNRSSFSSDTDEEDLASLESSYYDTQNPPSSGGFNSSHVPNYTWSTLPPTLFGITCSPAGQRAYSNHNVDIEESFLRLQREDGGRVENRTIAFSTHLTISRWEPTSESVSTTAASINSFKTASPPSEDSIDKSQSERTGSTETREGPRHNSSSCGYTSPKRQPQQQQNNPLYAARLMSLANYIRHIISLSSGTPPNHSQLGLAQQKQQQQQRHQQKLQACGQTSSVTDHQIRSNSIYGTKVRESVALSLPSPLSAGPGPIKSSAALSNRKHRYPSEYHDHQARRQLYRQHSSDQSRRDKNREQHDQSHQDFEPLDPLKEHTYRLPSPTSPTFSQSQTSSSSPLLKNPFPNLTLTLALIYVDRLKAKYPDAKGEAGCSLRLFLVAYIIAAKYRCSVELSAIIREHDAYMHRRATGRNPMTPMTPDNRSPQSTSESYEDDEAARMEQRLQEARSCAEAIHSNQEWVRLLSIGSFFRPPSAAPSSATPSSFGSAAAALSARTSPSEPMDRHTHLQTSSGKPEPKPLPIQSTAPIQSTGTESLNVLSGHTKNVSMTNLNPVKRPISPMHAITPTSATAIVMNTTDTTNATTTMTATTTKNTTSPTSILQIEDLDRMETEFLTFLDFDLSTKSQDLNTCWDLLVGNKEL
ncbi:hypothetical protein BGZ49_005109 [Haplosporangium sp. Z 27]|nr:hypothetical protein BGZ49_005109 [Haplosporangium sp. Z 27]